MTIDDIALAVGIIGIGIAIYAMVWLAWWLIANWREVFDRKKSLKIVITCKDEASSAIERIWIAANAKRDNPKNFHETFPNHKHQWERAAWRTEDGPKIINIDDVKDNFWAMATYRDRFICYCGGERIENIRALI